MEHLTNQTTNRQNPRRIFSLLSAGSVAQTLAGYWIVKYFTKQSYHLKYEQE